MNGNKGSDRIESKRSRKKCQGRNKKRSVKKKTNTKKRKRKGKPGRRKERQQEGLVICHRKVRVLRQESGIPLDT
jgi:hypothetical protein